MTHNNAGNELWDNAPADNLVEGDIPVWIESYRRRLHATQIPGRTGRRDQTLLLALGHLMAEKGGRVIHASYPELVRVSALTHRTVLNAVIACRQAGLLRVLGYIDDPSVGKGNAARIWRFALMLDALAPEEDVPPTSLTPLPRAADGDLAHDAFGGRRGIKPSHTALLRWIAAHPGCTLREVGASGVASRPTCYRVWGQLVERGFAHLDAAGCCRLADETEGALLGNVVDRERLHGAMDRRVQYAMGLPEQRWGRGRAGHWGMPR